MQTFDDYEQAYQSAVKRGEKSVTFKLGDQITFPSTPEGRMMAIVLAAARGKKSITFALQSEKVASSISRMEFR